MMKVPSLPIPALLKVLKNPLKNGRRLWIFLTLALIALIPFFCAIYFLGLVHPDEVYQWLEPLWHEVHGYGILTWEWNPDKPIRNKVWLYLMALFLRVGEALSLLVAKTLNLSLSQNPYMLRLWVALPQCILHLSVVTSTYLVAKKRGLQTFACLLAASLAHLNLVACIYAGRTTSETISTDFLLLCILLLELHSQSKPWLFFAGVALGMAAVTRNSAIVAVFATLFWHFLCGRHQARRPSPQASQSEVPSKNPSNNIPGLLRSLWQNLGRRLLDSVILFAGVSASAMLLGLVDKIAWGKPWISFINYLDFNILNDGAARSFGSSPTSFYWPYLRDSIPLWVFAGLSVFQTYPKRPLSSLPLFVALVYGATTFWANHKEPRFLYPIVSLISLSFAFQVASLFSLSSSKKSLAFMALVSAFSTSTLLPPEFATLRSEEFRAYVFAARMRKTTGILFCDDESWRPMPGHFYGGRALSLDLCISDQVERTMATLENKAFNRVVLHSGPLFDELTLHKGFSVAYKVGDAYLLAR